ncbi:MAG TPA: hypothetical protein VHB27_05620 [Rhodopila sp.]|uniref:hypothetical protein n=1 Tax=Rhodopila sp. TaxID=2480087 RepID=UPI002C95C176|nr:hypothetical protein [Rhodopila sp.]HVY14684.1 hypothetical protein [Rhodopila sp.]
MDIPRHFALLALVTLLAACSAPPPAQQAVSYPEPAPGTVTTHLNGSVGTTFSIKP